MYINDLDSKEKLIEMILGPTNNDDLCQIYYNEGRMHLDKSLQEYRLRNLCLKRGVLEVNLIYNHPSTGIKCLGRNVEYYDLAKGRRIIEDNYKKAKSYLQSNGYDYLLNGINRLEDLASHNMIVEGQELVIEETKSIDKLIKTIKNEINTKS